MSEQKKDEKIHRSRSILLVDDELSIRLFLKNYFGSMGITRIHEATNGEEAIKVIEKDPDIGLVIIDLMMPVMDGVEAIRRIRAVNGSVFIVVLTGYPQYRGVLDTAKSGAFVVMKPVELDDLDQVVQTGLTYNSLLE